MGETHDTSRAMLALVLTPGFGPRTIARAVEALGSAEAVLGASSAELGRLEGVGPRRAATLRAELDRVLAGGEVDRELQACDRAGVRLLALGAPGYPRLLALTPDPPPLLWVRGRLEERDAVALAVVGSRRCTAYGREQADRIAGQCAQAGVCIVSGGARGIDAAAHRAALRWGGRTVAVIGSGLAEPYPHDHAELFDQIVDGGGTHGAVVSELPMATPPAAENFPRRNRIISGLALGVLVVEAAARSGALITARLCVEDHGRELMALPGRVDSAASAGCHRMIRDSWAQLVTSAGDVLDALGEAGQLLGVEGVLGVTAGDEAPPGPNGSAAGGPQGLTLTDRQRRIVAAAAAEPRSLDELVAHTGLGVSEVQAELTLLEVRGVLRRSQGLFRARKGSPAGW